MNGASHVGMNTLFSLRPTSLWLINPSLLLQPRTVTNGTDNSESVTSPLLSSELPKDYGTITDERESKLTYSILSTFDVVHYLQVVPKGKCQIAGSVWTQGTLMICLDHVVVLLFIGNVSTNGSKR